MTTDPTAGLETVRAFANTLDVDEDVDGLATADQVGEWLVDHDLVDGPVDPSPGEVDLVIRTRDGIRALITATHHDDVDQEALTGLAEAVTASGLHPTFSAGHVDLAPTADGVPGALGRLLAFVHDAIAEGSWERLKLCANDTCRWAFFDQSRNRSGRWCDMAGCGNRAKVRAYRARAES